MIFNVHSSTPSLFKDLNVIWPYLTYPFIGVPKPMIFAHKCVECPCVCLSDILIWLAGYHCLSEIADSFELQAFTVHLQPWQLESTEAEKILKNGRQRTDWPMDWTFRSDAIPKSHPSISRYASCPLFPTWPKITQTWSRIAGLQCLIPCDAST